MCLDEPYGTRYQRISKWYQNYFIDIILISNWYQVPAGPVHSNDTGPSCGRLQLLCTVHPIWPHSLLEEVLGPWPVWPYVTALTANQRSSRDRIMAVSKIQQKLNNILFLVFWWFIGCKLSEYRLIYHFWKRLDTRNWLVSVILSLL